MEDKMISPDTLPQSEKKVNSCCMENSHYLYGEAVEWEVWKCRVCNLAYEIPIHIERHWDDYEVVAKEIADD